MYDEFRHFAKENLKSKRMTYYKLAKKIGFTESTIKCFMCGCYLTSRIRIFDTQNTKSE